MAVTLSTADSALKSVYLDVVSDHLNNSVNPFLSLVEKSTSDVWGKDVKKLIMSGYNGGVGAGTEEGALPSATGNNYAQITVPLKNLYGTIEISDKAIRASENNAGAFVNLLNAEMEGLLKASKANFGRMLFGDGSGKIAEICMCFNGVFTVTDPGRLLPGMRVDITDYDGNFIEKFNGCTIKSVNYVDGNVEIEGITLDDSTDPSQGYMYAHGSYGNELTGLGALFDMENDTLYGLSRSENPIMKPDVFDIAGELTENNMQTVIDRAEQRTGSTPNIILCSLGVRRALQKTFSQLGRTLPVMELAGGYKAISYNGIPVIADRFCPKKTAYFLNTNDFVLHQLCDWEWLEGDDGKILRQIPGKPVYTATLVKYAELVCNQPNAQTICTNVTEL